MTVIIFLLGAVAFYFVLRYVLIRQVDESLRAEQQEIQSYVEQRHQLPVIENTRYQWITVRPSPEPGYGSLPKTIRSLNPSENEMQWVRQLNFHLNVGSDSYMVTVTKSEVETEDLLKLIVPVVLFIVGLILIGHFIINRNQVTRLWQPFYHTLEKIKKYRLSGQEALHLPVERIDEISLLNTTLNDMTARIHKDYQVLKSFTENATHEMQTPLAVIRSKSDMLLQEPGLNEKSLELLGSIEMATGKLARLQQSLLMLSKLENQPFPLDEEVRMDLVLTDKFREMEEWIAARKIQVHPEHKPVTLSFHRQLAEMLVTNLLSNAARYTPENGRIGIYLDEKILQIKNTARNGALDPEKIFQRFYKAGNQQEGNGLGLSIVKEIANLAGYGVKYAFEEGEHAFTIFFHT